MRIRYNRVVKASSGGMDYADLKGMDFKKARDILTKDGFSEHEYGDKDDNNGYAVYRKGNKEVELQYRWNPGKRKNEYHAGKVTNVYVDDDINASCGKRSVKSSCNRKSVKAGYQLQFPYMVEGEFADGYTYTAGGNSEAGCVETLADMQDKHGELVWYSGITDEDYDAGRRIDSACSGKKKVKASTGNKHRSKIMAGPGAGYTIKWTLDKIDSVNSFNVVNVSRMDNYGTVTVTADCDIDVTVTIDSAWSYMYGFSEPIEGVSAKLSRIIFDFNVLDDTSLNPDDYEDGLQDKEFQDEVYNYVYQFNEMDAFNLLEYDAYEEIKSGEYNFGTGYIHTTWDGTIDEIDGDYNFADIKVTDQAVIDYVDKSVLGDDVYTHYQIVDHETEDVIDGGYETLEEAEGVANDLISNGAYSAIEIYRVSEKEKYNGDIDLIDDEYIEMIEF